MRRVLRPEMMDRPEAGREELAGALGFLRLVNRRLGGERALLRHLSRWSVNWPRDRPVTLLDIATGSADLPLAAVRWARARGFELRVTAVDAHPTTLDLALEHVSTRPELAPFIELRRADALRLMDCFEPGSFDYVHAGLFLHHLPQLEGLTVLRIMDRLARRGIVWNDLMRSGTALAGAWLLTLGRPEMVRHDALVSVRAGFTRAEALDAARRVGLDYTCYRLDPLAQRFTLAGERRGAWER